MAKTSDLSRLTESKSIAIWSKHNRWIKTSEGYQPYTVRAYPYLLGVLRSIQDPNVDRVIIQAGTQVGKTEAAISALFWFLLEKRVNCLYMLPHQSALSDFSSSRLSPIIENSPIGSAFSSTDNVRLKTTTRGSSLYLRAAGAAEAQMEEFSISALFRDEFAHYDDKVVELSEKRLGSAKSPTIVDLGHPLYSGNRLSQAYGDSSQFEWHYTCPECKKTQRVDFFAHYYDRDGELSCKSCGFPWEKQDILNDGFWKALGSENNPVHGYRIPRTISPNQDLAEMAQKYEQAQSGGGTRVAIFNQTYLAREFSASGQTLSPGEVKAIMTGPSTASVEPKNTILGVDVGKPLYYTVLKDHRVLAFGKAENYDELSRVRERWDCQICALDAAPEYHKSREWIESLPPEVRGWLITTKGRGQVHEPKGNLEKRKIQIHQVESFDRLFESVRKKNLQLPSDSPPQVEVHFTDPVKLVEEDSPSIEKGTSHWCDSTRYAQAAQIVSGQIPSPERQKVFDELKTGHVVTKLKPIERLTVGINVTDKGDFAFALVGITPHQRLLTAGEFYYDGDKSYSHYDIYNRLGEWLEEQRTRLGKVMLTPRSKVYLQPYGITNHGPFAREAWTLRDQYWLKIRECDTEVETRIAQIKALLSKDGLLIHKSCVKLLEEMEETKWGDKNHLVLPALAHALVHVDRFTLKAPGKKTKKMTNKELVEKFFK